MLFNCLLYYVFLCVYLFCVVSVSVPSVVIYSDLFVLFAVRAVVAVVVLVVVALFEIARNNTICYSINQAGSIFPLW